MLVIMAGLPGTGKSALARGLASRLGAVRLDKDEIRAALFPPELIEYSREQDDFCMQVLLQTAEFLLRRRPNQIIIIDGRPFARGHQLKAVFDFANRAGTSWKVIECRCSEETIRQRLERDAKAHPAANRNYALYQALRDDFEPIPEPKLVLDTERSLGNVVEDCLRYLKSDSHSR